MPPVDSLPHSPGATGRRAMPAPHVAGKSATEPSTCQRLICPIDMLVLRLMNRGQPGEGEIWLTLRHRWADGTTHLRFDPLELLERLAVLTPRPRVNLILYYGVLAPRAAWRAALVPAAAYGVNASPAGRA